jgi:tRNA (cmo5U34)-methyltransferase
VTVAASANAKEASPPPHEVGDGLAAGGARWSFGGPTSANFDSHVSRSVPSYREGHDLVVRLSDFFLGAGSVCYELGCSTAALTERLARHHDGKGVRFIGIDVEPDMVRIGKQRCVGLDQVSILDADAVTYEFENADLIVAYYTVQFIHPKFRQALLDKLYQTLNWGGALLLFEKVRAPDARFQDISTQLYADYKLEGGYAPSEIMAKTRSLKGVLEPFSTQGNLDLLRRSGFVDVMTVMKYVCFEGFLAIK